jgi:hypothetical protein
MLAGKKNKQVNKATHAGYSKQHLAMPRHS